MMKLVNLKTTILTAFIALAHFGYGQQVALNAQYDMISSIQNPAYNGIGRSLRVDALSRNQWSNFPGTPKYTALAFQSPLSRDFAIGANFQTLSVGKFTSAPPLSMTSAAADIAYHTQLNKNLFMSVGLRLGVFNFSMRITQLIADVPSDIAQVGNDYNFISPTVGGGIMAYGKQYFIGVSLPQFAVIPSNIVDNVNLGYNARSFYMLNAGYIHPLNKIFSLKTTVQTRMYEGLPILLDANVYMLYKDVFTMGYGYRSTNAHAIMSLLRVNEHFKIMYAYEFGKVYDNKTQFNSNEFGLTYTLNHSKQKVIISPRHY